MRTARFMRSLRWRLGVAAVGLVLFALAGAATAQPPSGIVHPTPERGKSPRELGSELFAANCVSCHGIDGRGIQMPRPGGAGDLTGQGPSLRHVGAQAPDFYLRTGRMPIARAGEEPERQRPYFSNREIKGLVAYISSFGKGPGLPHPRPGRGSLPSGLQLFTDNCAGCHQVAGEGGFVTGARVPVLRHATARQIAEAVRIGPFLMPRFGPGQISRHQLDDIVAYVKSIRSPDDRGGLGIGHIGPVPEGMVAWLVVAVVLVGVCLVIGERRRRA
jgi:ubiquinol-cytochrome c reductase cytochrome c subunit